MEGEEPVGLIHVLSERPALTLMLCSYGQILEPYYSVGFTCSESFLQHKH